MRNAALVVLVIGLGAVANAGADGMLDPSFGNGGLVITNFPGAGSTDIAYAVLVLPDGRAVAAGKAGSLPGQMAVARYLSSGSLDPTFGGDGLVTIPSNCPPVTPSTEANARAVLLQPDGRLVLVGTCPNVTTGPVFWLVRLNADGSLDPSFGQGGQVFTPVPGGAVATAGLVQPDGRIVAVGWGVPSRPRPLVAARFNPDGSVDGTFGTGGQVVLAFADDFTGWDVVRQSDGKLVIGGGYGSSLPFVDFGLVRLLPDGGPDPSFGRDGLVTSNFGGPETGQSLIVLGDGRLLLAGTRTSGATGNDFALVRYLSDGTVDTSFGVGGLASADGGGDDTAWQVVELPNGKLLVGGDTGGSPDFDLDFLLARFQADGALDTSFGKAGFIQTDVGSTVDECFAVAIAGPDLILTAGHTFTNQGLGDVSDFALARYIASTPVELLAFEVE